MWLSVFKITTVCLTLAWLALPGAAQTIQPIYSFTYGPATPEGSLVQGPDGNFYGTSYSGGTYNDGTVFQITTNGVWTTLVNFTGTNGQNPSAGLVLAPDGNFYGTTFGGGANGYGTVFRVATNGSLTTVVTFTGLGGTGVNPAAGLTLGSDGNLYGTTRFGGAHRSGTVFQMKTNGAPVNLYSFSATASNGILATNFDGANPYGNLTLGNDGSFYGTTYNGGTNGYGTVFRITTNGSLNTLVHFAGTNGAGPVAGLTLGNDGNLYGTTAIGGSSYGTVFMVTTNGALTTLVIFEGTNGAVPYAGLTQGTDGNFYGTTFQGGCNGDGTIFMVATNGTLTTLACLGTNGPYFHPSAGMTLGNDGNLYGTTTETGDTEAGSFFMLTTNGTVTNLANFSNPNGIYPNSGLTLGPDGNFYGTATRAGTNGYGTVFKLDTNGTLTTLVTFDGTNGANPYAGLTPGPDGNFYGAAITGGSNNDGTIFRVSTDGTLATLVSFSLTNGTGPMGSLTWGPDGNLYGMTIEGGNSNLNYGFGGGSVFRVTTNGSLTTLLIFEGTNGANPWSGQLALGPDGNFYGTTYYGGSSNCGTVFQITTNGALTTLASFTNGENPSAWLAPGPDGIFYGTTRVGLGTMFQITTNGALTTLAAFINSPGAGEFPGALTLEPDGNLYGTTEFGTTTSFGTVFRITTNGSVTALASFNQTRGQNPGGALTLGPEGSLYGTTFEGGNGGGIIYRLDLRPSIITQPSNQIAAVGSNANFTVALFGTAPFTYQWLSNSTLIPEATNSTFTIPDVTPSSAANYQVIVTNAWGSVTSSVATLSLGVSPMITNQPASESVPIGGTANFAVGAGGTPPLSYQWYFNTNITLGGATNALLSFGPVLSSQTGNYQVIVTSPYGNVTSGVAGLTVLLQPNCYGISNSGPGSVTLFLASTPGSTNRLWSTTNLNLPLSQWLPIFTNASDVGGLFQFTDTNSGDAPARFYILSSP